MPIKKSIICLLVIAIATVSCNNSENNKNTENGSTEIIEPAEVNDVQVESEEQELEGKLAEFLKDKKLV